AQAGGRRRAGVAQAAVDAAAVGPRQSAGEQSGVADHGDGEAGPIHRGVAAATAGVAERDALQAAENEADADQHHSEATYEEADARPLDETRARFDEIDRGDAAAAKRTQGAVVPGAVQQRQQRRIGEDRAGAGERKAQRPGAVAVVAHADERAAQEYQRRAGDAEPEAGHELGSRLQSWLGQG